MILNLSLVVLVPISYNLLSYNYAYNHINSCFKNSYFNINENLKFCETFIIIMSYNKRILDMHLIDRIDAIVIINTS